MRGVLAVAFLSCGTILSAQDGPTWVEVSEIFSQKCIICHSGADAPLGLDLTTLQSSLAGSENGPVLRSGNPGDSKLAQRIRGNIEPRMPLDGPPYLSADMIGLIENWVIAGMPAGRPVNAQYPEIRRRPKPGEAVNYADVKSIFLKRCIICHSDNSVLGRPPEGLRLGSLEEILAGGERLAVLPGEPLMSNLWRRVVGLETPRMPFDGPPWLSKEDIRLLRDWIQQGTPNSENVPAPMPTGARVRLRGKLTARNAIDGAFFQLGNNTRIDKNPRIGRPAEMRGVVNADGSVRATRLRRR